MKFGINILFIHQIFSEKIEKNNLDFSDITARLTTTDIHSHAGNISTEMKIVHGAHAQSINLSINRPTAHATISLSRALVMNVAKYHTNCGTKWSNLGKFRRLLQLIRLQERTRFCALPNHKKIKAGRFIHVYLAILISMHVKRW